MNDREAGDFIYSLRKLTAGQQEAALQAKLAEDPTLKDNMAFALWEFDPHNLNRKPPPSA